VPLDALIQRHAQRQLRRGLAVASVAATALVAIATSIALFLFARAQARIEQRQGVATVAQLVGQRAQFSKAGRLDLLRAQDMAALNFFRGRDVATLPPAAQLLSAQLLHGISEDNDAAGDLAGLNEASSAALRTTARLLAERPDDPDRIFSHAQSEYWVGLAAWRGGDTKTAKRYFQGYANLADRLATRAPRRADWLREAGDANSNLATLSLRTGDLTGAEKMFRAALERFLLASNIGPYDRDVESDLADGFAWLADVERLRGRLAQAQVYREAQRQALLEMRKRDRDDAEIETGLIKNTLGMARIAALQERWSDAIALFERGRAAALARAEADRANVDVAREVRAFALFQVRTWLDMPTGLRPPHAKIAAMLGDCGDDRARLHSAEAADFCSILSARLLTSQGKPDAARKYLGAVAQGNCAPALSERWLLDLCVERMRAKHDLEAATLGR
jgi:hypothetical protein